MTDAWKDKWKDVVAQTHSDQAIWFLNGFWDEIEKDKDSIWDMVHMMIEIECGSPKLYGSKSWDEKEGCDLDQFQSHRFLEKFGETLTVKELSGILKKIDIDNNRKMCLTEYLVYKYSKDGPTVVNSPQGGGDPEEFERAKQTFNDARTALRQANEAKEELDQAMGALEAEEKKFNDLVQKWEKKVNNPRLSSMKIAAAKNELAQLQGKDPLPLTKAKLTTKAAQKKSKRAVKAAKKKFEEAHALFEVLKKGGGAALGAIWWMERSLEETQKYAPGKRKKKAK